MDGATISICVSSALAVGLLLAGWIWDTRNNVGHLEANFNKELALAKQEINKELAEVKEDLERHNTMIEPFWQTLCDNLPIILKMHNSPDPLAAVLKGEPTVQEIEALIVRINDDLKTALANNDDTKAYGYVMALAMAKAKLSWLTKQREKNRVLG